MALFGPQDTYKISNLKNDGKFTIDYKVLVRLYLPIIGSSAMSLYLVLDSEKSLNKWSRKKYNIARLHKLLQIDEKEFNDAISKLINYGLIKHSGNKNDATDYLFKMIPTKTANEFFEDEKLSSALAAVVDNNYFEQIKDYFITSSINEDDYVDIDESGYSLISNEEDFYDSFYAKYQIIASFNPINDNDKKEIARIKKLFKFDYQTIEKIILDSLESNDNGMFLNKEKLNENAEKLFKEKQPVSQDDKIVQLFENEKSMRFYERNVKRTLRPSDLDTIEYILDTYKIPEGVLNVVIHYYYSKPNNSLSNPRNYFIKVIEEMLRCNVKTTLDAMNFLRNKNNKYKEKQTQKVEPIKVETVPLKENQQTTNSNTLNEFLKLMEED